ANVGLWCSFGAAQVLFALVAASDVGHGANQPRRLAILAMHHVSPIELVRVGAVSAAKAVFFGPETLAAADAMMNALPDSLRVLRMQMFSPPTRTHWQFEHVAELGARG